MTNKKSFFEKLTGSIKFNDDEEYNIYEDEYLEEDEEKKSLEIESDDVYEDEDEIGELSVDMYKIDNAIIIKTMVAGIQKSDIDITLTRDMVVIEGARQPENLGKIQDTYFEELFWGSFERTIELPEEVDIELAEAHENHGLLTLVLPLVDKHRQARLKIK
jgi:HSP20 family protein